MTSQKLLTCFAFTLDLILLDSPAAPAIIGDLESFSKDVRKYYLLWTCLLSALAFTSPIPLRTLTESLILLIERGYLFFEVGYDVRRPTSILSPLQSHPPLYLVICYLTGSMLACPGTRVRASMCRLAHRVGF